MTEHIDLDALEREARRKSQHYASGFKQSGHVLMHPDTVLAFITMVRLCHESDPAHLEYCVVAECPECSRQFRIDKELTAAMRVFFPESGGTS
jgi:hypothetical protein